MDNFGILTLIPPIVIIVFALVTRRTFEALLLGSVIAFFYTAKLNVVNETLNQLQETFSNEKWILITMFMLGAFAYLLRASKGSLAFGAFIRKWAKTEKKTLMSAYVLGIIVFMDDYLNLLTISSATLDTCDKNRTPREMLAYVMDSTGAPVCVLVPISSWAVYFAGVMESTMEGYSGYGTGMEMYISSIPFLFYAWAAIIIVPLVILGVIPKVFGMKKAYERVASGGNVWPDDGSEELNVGIETEDVDIEQIDRFGLRIAGFFIPLIVVIVVTIITGDLIPALFWALVTMMVMYIPTKLVSFHQFCDEFANGAAYMVPMNLIILGALTVKTAMDNIGLPDYVIGLTLPFMSPKLFFALAFITVAALSFITGSNWGIPAVTFPILIPLAMALNVSPIITLACIVSGGTFGSHICFYSDATVLTSQCCRIKNLAHAFTQFPYGLLGAIVAIIAYTITGFVLY